MSSFTGLQAWSLFLSRVRKRSDIRTVESLLHKPMMEPSGHQTLSYCAPIWATRCRDREGAWPPGGSCPHLLSASPAQPPLFAAPALAGPGRFPASPEFQQIVCGAEHLPLAVTGSLPSWHTPVTAPGTLDLSEHRLDRLAVAAPAAPGAVANRCSGQSTARARPDLPPSGWPPLPLGQPPPQSSRRVASPPAPRRP